MVVNLISLPTSWKNKLYLFTDVLWCYIRRSLCLVNGITHPFLNMVSGAAVKFIKMENILHLKWVMGKLLSPENDRGENYYLCSLIHFSPNTHPPLVYYEFNYWLTDDLTWKTESSMRAGTFVVLRIFVLRFYSHLSLCVAAKL